jgi:hypothetical protein
MEVVNQFQEQTPEQKQYKATKDAFKSSIKKLEDDQRNHKAGRKGEDKSQAQRYHALNRYALRHHYIAYSQFRRENSTYSKTLPQVKPGTEIDTRLISRLITSYGSKTVHINKG